MSGIRFRGLLTVLAAAAIMAPGWYYLWLVDYRNAPEPAWLNALSVGFLTGGMVLVVRGVYAMATGKVLGSISIHKRL